MRWIRNYDNSGEPREKLVMRKIRKDAEQERISSRRMLVATILVKALPWCVWQTCILVCINIIVNLGHFTMCAKHIMIMLIMHVVESKFNTCFSNVDQNACLFMDVQMLKIVLTYQSRFVRHQVLYHNSITNNYKSFLSINTLTFMEFLCFILDGMFVQALTNHAQWRSSSRWKICNFSCLLSIT
mgnify:CR=1 FL=1